MKRTLMTIAISTSALFSNMSHAGLVNPGFETGDLTGWTANLNGGSAFAVTNHNGYLPVEGNFFLAIGAGAANVWQTVSQTVSLNAGEVLAGSAAFNWEDYSPYLDGARVRILNSLGNLIAEPFYMDGSGHPAYWDGPWTVWSWQAVTAGQYILEYAVRNTGDANLISYGYFDLITQNVPEPTSLALLGVGMAGLAFYRRRKYA